MAYSLRLPDTLDAAARDRASNMGISLNALICVALDGWLRAAGENPQSTINPLNPGQAGVEPDGAVRKTDTSTTTFQSSKAERREHTRQQRLARKSQR